MRDLVRPLALMGAVLLVPIVPFLIFGQQFEAWAESFTQNPPAWYWSAPIIVGLLATDIFLPVPSSLISTMGGWTLGGWGGTLASWAGMSAGAILGFALARRWGRAWALWISREASIQKMERLSDRFGPLVVVLTRGVPVFAEASVLLMGMHGLAWRRFLPPLLLSNLGLAAAYSFFGEYAQRHAWLPLALGVSIALPVLLATAVSRWIPRGDDSLPTTSAAETKVAADAASIGKKDP